MKTFLRFLDAACFLAVALAACFCAVGLVTFAHAQTDSASVNVAIETGAVLAQPFIVTFAQGHPWLLTALAIMATARLVFKPIMTGIEAAIRATPSQDDDVKLDLVEHSLAYRIFAWMLDYLGSIKVGPQLAPKPASATAKAPDPDSD